MSTRAHAADQSADSDTQLTQEFLLSHWKSQHRLVQHEGKDKELKKESETRYFQPSKCYKLGSCVCDRQGPIRMMMLLKLLKYLKDAHPGTQKAPTPQRANLCDGLVVIELSKVHSSEADYDEAKSIFLHLGYVNFKIWSKTVVLKLDWVQNNPFTGRTLLQCDEDTLETMTLLGCIKAYWDPIDPCFLTLWAMSDDPKFEVGHQFMYPKFIDVMKISTGGSDNFWQGADLEQQLEKASRKPRQPRNRKGPEAGEDKREKPSRKRKKPEIPGHESNTGTGPGDPLHPEAEEEALDAIEDIDIDMIFEELLASDPDEDGDDDGEDGEDGDDDDLGFFQHPDSHENDADAAEASVSGNAAHTDTADQNDTDNAAADDMWTWIWMACFLKFS